MIDLERVELMPVLELEPFRFSTQNRSLAWRADAQERHQYWLECLADSGLVGLTPLSIPSWHVPTTEMTDPIMLGRYVSVVIEHWGGLEVLDEPDLEPFLNGGCALCQGGNVLIEPQCCCDLRNITDWDQAVTTAPTDWQMLWIGHPYVFVKRHADRLIISELQKGDDVTTGWSVPVTELKRAIAAAKAELQRFAQQLPPILISLGYRGNSELMAKKLAGLSE